MPKPDTEEYFLTFQSSCDSRVLAPPGSAAPCKIAPGLPAASSAAPDPPQRPAPGGRRRETWKRQECTRKQEDKQLYKYSHYVASQTT